VTGGMWVVVVWVVVCLSVVRLSTVTFVCPAQRLELLGIILQPPNS